MLDNEKRQSKPFETLLNDDDRELVALGYKPSFKREFSNLATVRFLSKCFENAGAHHFSRLVLPSVSWYISILHIHSCSMTDWQSLRVCVPVLQRPLIPHYCWAALHLYGPSYS